MPWGLLTAAALIAAWLIAAPQTPDLAGQVYRAGLFERAGFVLWDNAWYAGHHVPGYSLTWPALGALVGVRVSGALAVLASAVLFERLARLLYGPRVAAPASVWFAVAAAGDAWIGRLTFALGVTFALASALVLARGIIRRRPHRTLAAALAAISAATSPVAALLFVLALFSLALGQTLAAPRASGARAFLSALGRRLRPFAAVIAAALAVVIALQLLFPEGGFEPYAASSIAGTLAVTLAFVLALPPQEKVLRVAAYVYVVVNLLSLIPTPMGSNIQRYGILLAGPILLCALGVRGGLGASRLPRWALLPALAGMALWVVWGPIVQTRGVIGDPSTNAAFYAPVERFLAARDAQPLRIEVPFTRAHWEAAYLAPHVLLARGWERQLDKRYDRVLESHSLSAPSYRGWLDREGVSYVALPDAPFDESSEHEVRLIEHGLPYLREELHDARWRIFRVLDASPLAVSLAGGGSGGARVTAIGTENFALSLAAPGRFLVKVRYTPYWSVTAGAASVREGPGGFTEVRASRAGRVEVSARFSPSGAAGALRAAFEGA